MKDSSGVQYPDSSNNSETYQVYVKKTRVNKPLQNQLIEKLKEKGYSEELTSNDGSWMSGMLTHDSFNVLIRNEHVDSVWLKEKGYEKVWELPYQVNLSYIKSCISNDDCSLVKKDCCGYEGQSVNKGYIEFYQDQKLRECFFRSCAARVTVWDYDVKCENGGCVEYK